MPYPQPGLGDGLIMNGICILRWERSHPDLKITVEAVTPLRQTCRVPNKKASGPLSAIELATLAEASLTNATAIVGEARMLHDAGSIPRSYSLAVLAAEEFGKCQLAVGTLGRRPKDAEAEAAYWKEWWGIFYWHGPKLVRAAGMAGQLLPVGLIEPFIRHLEAALRTQRRESGYYVDVVDGQVVSPMDAIGREEAAEAIQCFSIVIEAYADMFREVGLATAYLEQHDGKGRDMREALASRDPDRVRSTWEATIGNPIDEERLKDIVDGWAAEEASGGAEQSK